jgi:hypothetical protein
MKSNQLSQQARQLLPLRKLMAQRGRGPADGNWKSFPACPYCQGKSCAGIFSPKSGRVELFKCHQPDCPSGTAVERGAWNEVAFLAYELGCPPREAFTAWCQEAGLRPEAGGGARPTSAAVPVAPPDGGFSDPPAAGEYLEATAPGPEEGGGIPQDVPADRSGDTWAAVTAKRRFFEQIKLTDEDRAKLWTERGLTPETCEKLGFRSSVPANLEVLLALKAEFPMGVLLEAALWVQGDEPGAEPKPNLQFTGWGVVGKSKVNSDEFEWGWTHPVLIPYVDAKGEVLDIRPHKRTQRGQCPRLYVPRPLKGFPDSSAGKLNPTYAVLTEGEFKSAALFQVLGPEALIAGLPGITMAKPLFGDIEDLLGEAAVRRVVVVYDNECKDNPLWPGFKADPNQRYDAEVSEHRRCGA